MNNDVVKRSLAVFFNPCAQMQDMVETPPFEVVSADGVWMQLADGRRLLDGIASWWCKSLGHGHPRLLAALQAQSQSFEHVIAANTTHQGLVSLCERLLAMANGDEPRHWQAGAAAGKRQGFLSRVFLADNGSTAVEIALKMAIQAQAQWGQTRRVDFACLEGGYHGETIATLAVGDCDIYSSPFRPLMFPSLRLAGLPLRSGPDDPQWMDAGAEWPALEAQLNQQAQTLAAVVFEPVLQGAGGMRIISPDLLPRLRQWADRAGVLLIADEIAAGFGRCGAMLASHLAPQPALADLVCVSKGLTAGVTPLSAVLLSEPIYQAFYSDYASGRSFLHSNTWTGHALGIAVANAVLDEMAAGGHAAAAQRRSADLRARLGEVASGWSVLGAVRGVGMVAALDIAAEPGQRVGRQVFQAALDEDLFLRSLGNTLYVFPPLTITDAELDQLFSRLRRALFKVFGPCDR